MTNHSDSLYKMSQSKLERYPIFISPMNTINEHLDFIWDTTYTGFELFNINFAK